LSGDDVGGCVESIEHLSGQLPEHGDLVAGEPVEEQPPNSIDVTRRGGFDGASARIGERDESSAAIVGAPLTADEATLGKPVGNDLRERKMTVPLVLSLDGADREFRADVERFFEEEDDTRGRIEGIVTGIRGHGGLAKTEAALAGYVERAKASLAPLGNAPARSELVALADALL